MNLISHGVLNGPVYNGSDFTIKSYNSNKQNFIITLYVNLNSSSKVYFWENLHTLAWKITFYGRLHLNEDICSGARIYRMPLMEDNNQIIQTHLHWMHILGMTHICRAPL